MSSTYKAVQHKKDEILNIIKTILTNTSKLKQLSCKELDDIINSKYMLQTPRATWIDIQTETLSIKQQYISSQDSDEQRIKAIFHWNDPSICTNVSLASLKSTIIQIINNGNKGIYYMVWDMITKNKLEFSRDDIDTITPKFFEYVSEQSRYSTPLRDMQYFLPAPSTKDKEAYSSDDDAEHNDNSNNRTNMNAKEQFWVNVISNNNPQVHQKLNQYLICLALDADQRLRYMPQCKFSFTGELTQQIIKYYDSLTLSPLINCRRNLTVCLNNHTSSFHYFADVFNKQNQELSQYCDKIAVEFPHLCYVYPTRVEIDYVDSLAFSCSSEDETKLYIYSGQEYILTKTKPYKPSTPKDNTYKHNEVKTLNLKFKKEDSGKPCCYISIGSIKYANILYNMSGIRVYGEAVIMV